jgi:hypothetical protein
MHSEIQVNEMTYGLATELELVCSRCEVLPLVKEYKRGWKSHCLKVTQKRRENSNAKSVICNFDVNIRYCTALQMIGVGGEHDAVMTALLDLPDPHKWPPQFSVIEKHL